MRASRSSVETMVQSEQGPKEMLEARRRDLLARLRRDIREATGEVSTRRSDDVLDSADDSEAMHEAGLRFALIHMTSEMLSRIDNALARIAENRYGSCEACGEAIGESRLRAIPFAVRCRNCEEIQEATRRRIPGSEYLSRSLFRL